MTNKQGSVAVVIPAAGVGKRMQADYPKQYLTIANKTILEHTVERLLSHPQVALVVLSLGADDECFPQTSLFNHPQIQTVTGGKERVDSVLAGLKVVDDKQYPWVMVHDAARPCVTHDDISKLINACLQQQQGGLLASPVRDTMKQAAGKRVDKTIDRSALWHAFTPQMYLTKTLTQAIEQGLQEAWVITDESSAIEQAGLTSQLVEGRSDNIKITRHDDLALASFILQQQSIQADEATHSQLSQLTQEQELSCE